MIRRHKYDEEMIKNPTPEFLAARKAEDAERRKEYGFRKACGMLTNEEKERERLHPTPAPTGLGISIPSELAAQYARVPHMPYIPGRSLSQPDLRLERTGDNSPQEGVESAACRGMEELTGTFNIEGFDPRLSRLGSPEVKRYIQESTICEQHPGTLVQPDTRFLRSLDPRQSPAGCSPKAQSTSMPRRPSLRKAASTSNLSTSASKYSHPAIQAQLQAIKAGSPILPTVGIHPALRQPQPSSTYPATPRTAAPRLSRVAEASPEKDASSTIPSEVSTTPDNVRRQVITTDQASEHGQTESQSATQPRKKSHLVRARSGSKRSPLSKFTSSFASLARLPKLGPGPKSAPLSRKTSVSATKRGFRVLPPRANASELTGNAGAKTSPKPSVSSPPPNTERHGEDPPADGTKGLELAVSQEARMSRPPTLLNPSELQALDLTCYDPDETALRPLSTLTPRDRLSAKRSGIPVAPGSSLNAVGGLANPATRRRRHGKLPVRNSGRQWAQDPAQAAGDQSRAGPSNAPVDSTTDAQTSAWQPTTSPSSDAQRQGEPNTETEDEDPRNRMQYRIEQSTDLAHAAGLDRQRAWRRVQAQAPSGPSVTSAAHHVPRGPPREQSRGDHMLETESHGPEGNNAPSNHPSTPERSQRSTPTAFTVPRATMPFNEAVASWSPITPTHDRHSEELPSRLGNMSTSRRSEERGMTPGEQPSRNEDIWTSRPAESGDSAPNTLSSTDNTESVLDRVVSAPLGHRRASPLASPRTLGRRNFSNPGYSTPTSGPSKLRQMTRSKFPGEHYADKNQAEKRIGTENVEDDICFQSVIEAWQKSSPLPTQESHASLTSFHSQEIQALRSEAGLEPLREHIPGNERHPNHHYTWNTKKLMCRRIHNPGVVLPALPSPTLGKSTNMAEYADEFFISNPYTDEPRGPERCTSCQGFCCRFSDMVVRAQTRDTDIFLVNERHRIQDLVAKLRVTKPNGIEEWSSFLTCSQCERRFCPDCIVLCSEELCQEPVCVDCREARQLCRIHNMF